MNRQRRKARLLVRVQAEYAGWEVRLSEIGEAQMTETGVAGEWSIKDIVAHLTPFAVSHQGCLQAALLQQPPLAPPSERLTRLTAQGKAPRLLVGSLVLALRQQPISPLLVPAECGTIPRRTSDTTHPADLACRLPAGAPGDVLWATGRGTPCWDQHHERPKEPCRRQRPRKTAPRQRAAGTCVLGPPVGRASTAVPGATIPLTKPEDLVSRSAELGVRGARGAAN